VTRALRKAAVEQDGRQGRAQGDGHHQVEGVHLRQGALARKRSRVSHPVKKIPSKLTPPA